MPPQTPAMTLFRLSRRRGWYAGAFMGPDPTVARSATEDVGWRFRGGHGIGVENRAGVADEAVQVGPVDDAGGHRVLGARAGEAGDRQLGVRRDGDEVAEAAAAQRPWLRED